MADKRLVWEVRKLDGLVDEMIARIKGDSVMKASFTKVWSLVVEEADEKNDITTGRLAKDGGANDALHDDAYREKFHACYRAFLKHLNKEMPPEKHDSHGLHGLVKTICAVLKRF
tara:strand:+ start:229 stop:573 length:345 start_codon:yes stop_codon:yes gene_type:complete